MKTRLLGGAIFLSTALVVPSYALAIAGTDVVVTKGQETKSIPGWPEGVLELINDPLRANGWHRWFSECPNDGHYFEMDVRGPEDVNHLIKILAAVKTDAIQLQLDAAEGASHANGVGAVFAIGNQPIVNRWFLTLREAEPGIRAFGVHRYRAPPAAQPPTLTLYVGHQAVDLQKLAIPANIEVTAPNSISYRAKYKDTFKTIDQFVERHRAQQKKASDEKAVEK